ncbi:MAG: RND family transporter [Desulfobacteraceae bacterium]|nr:MAG: RND family transporter [Desulfobacteraceae bacterium]
MMKLELYKVIARTIMGFPRITLVVFILLSLAAGALLPGLSRDPSPYLLPPSHDSRVNLKELRKTYTGSNDGIIVLLEAEDTVFNPATLARVKALTLAFEQIHLVTERDQAALAELVPDLPVSIAQKVSQLATGPVDPETWMRIEEVREIIELSDETGSQTIAMLSGLLETWMEKLSPIIEVTSLSNTDNILGKDGKLDVNPPFDDIPISNEALSRVEKEVRSNALFDHVLVADGGRATSIVLELAPADDKTDEQFDIYTRVKHIVEKEIPGPENHYIAGLPVVTGALGMVMEQDTQKLFPVVILIVLFCLFITFRKLKGILVPLMVVILSLVVTLGLKSLFNIPLNIITTTLPVFVLSIGVADGIHMFSEYRDHVLQGYDRQNAILLTLKHLAMPVVMTSITTATAFYAISMTQIVQLHYFGIFVAVGAMVAMLFSLFFIPALLMLLPEKGNVSKRSASKIEETYEKSLVAMTRGFLRYPFRTGLITVAVFLLSLFGASQVVVDNNNVGYFLKSSDIYISSQKLNKVAAGSSLINFLVTDHSDRNEPFKQAENLQYVDQLVMFLKAQDHVGKVLGLTELIKRINFALNDEQDRFNRVPPPSKDAASKHLTSQLLLLYENGGGDTLSDYSDSEYKQLNIPVILRTNSSRDTYKLDNKVKAFVNRNFPSHIKVAVSGSANVSVAATDEIVRGQMVSLMVSFAVVLVMLFITFRSLTYAAIAIIPLVMTVTINFGIMGFLDIPLDIGTAVISSIVIGIGVDYAIHYLSRLKADLQKGLTFSEALENTVSRSGKAIVSNAATVGLGFVALWFSVLTPLVTMGWMITLTMLVSAFCTLVLIPVMLVFIEKRSLDEIIDQTSVLQGLDPRNIGSTQTN